MKDINNLSKNATAAAEAAAKAAARAAKAAAKAADKVKKVKVKKQSFLLKAFSPFTFLISGLLAYGSKIPVISKATKVLSVWYGRTTWWKMLIYMRKCFIIINAIIGVYTVFRITGFSTDNVIAGIAGLGGTYVEIFTSFVKRLFRWFHDLLDFKVVPKPSDSWWPGENGSKTSVTILGEDKSPEPFISLRETYKNSNSSFNTSWIPNWIYYGLLAILTGGVIYVCYSLYNDTGIFNSNEPLIDKGKGRADDNNPPPEPGPSRLVSTFLSVTNGINMVTSSIIGIPKAISSVLNPFNWVNSGGPTPVEQIMQTQVDYNHSNLRLYPYTLNNPYDSWFTKFRLAVFGETEFERTRRMQFRAKMLEPFNFTSATEDFDDEIGITTPGIRTPIINIGLAPGVDTTFETNTVWDEVRQRNIKVKMDNIPPTPVHTPGELPSTGVIEISENILNQTEVWSNHSADSVDSQVGVSATHHIEPFSQTEILDDAASVASQGEGSEDVPSAPQSPVVEQSSIKKGLVKGR